MGVIDMYTPVCDTKKNPIIISPDTYRKL